MLQWEHRAGCFLSSQLRCITHSISVLEAATGGAGKGDPSPPVYRRGQLVPIEDRSWLHSRLTGMLEGLHRLIMVLSGLKHTVGTAREQYVRHFLQQACGPDSYWTVEHALIKYPGLVSLSVGRQLDPALSWLRSHGVDPGAVVASCPQLLGASLDDQLQPLADLIDSVGASTQAVLLQFPAVAVTLPVERLRATLAALRAAGATDKELRGLLEQLPDLLVSLASVLHDEGASSGTGDGDAKSSAGWMGSSGAQAEWATTSASASSGVSSEPRTAAAGLPPEGLGRVRAALQAALQEAGGQGQEAACLELERAIEALAGAEAEVGEGADEQEAQASAC